MHSDIRRDKLDIILRILEVGSSPVKKTHILYKAGINFYQLSRYLNFLLKLGLLEELSEPYVGYRTTEKGRACLKLFNPAEFEEAQAVENRVRNTSRARRN